MEPAAAPSGSSGDTGWFSRWYSKAPPPADASASPTATPPSPSSSPPPVGTTAPDGSYSTTVTTGGANGAPQQTIRVVIEPGQNQGGGFAEALFQTAIGVGGIVVAMYLVNRYIMGSDKSDFRYERFQEKDDEDEEAAPLSIDDQMHAFEQFWAGPMPDALLEVLHWWHSPALLDQFSDEMPKGLLLVGPPGTGKTHFARTLARVSSSAFFEANAAQFDEVYVGVGAQRVRRLFEQAEESTYPSGWKRWGAWMNKHDPPERTRAIIFIDELDAIGTRQVFSNTNNASHQTVAQLLTYMDGLRSDSNVFVVAATNNIQALDPALLRSGRFDRIVQFKLPNREARVRLLMHYVRLKKAVCSENHLKEYAAKSKGWNAADLKLFIDEATAIARKILFTKMTQSKKTKDKEGKDAQSSVSSADAALVFDGAALEEAYGRVADKLALHSQPEDGGMPTTEDLYEVLHRFQQRGQRPAADDASHLVVQEVDELSDEPDD